MAKANGISVDYSAGLKMIAVAVAIAVMVYVVVRIMESINRRRGGSD